MVMMVLVVCNVSSCRFVSNIEAVKLSRASRTATCNAAKEEVMDGAMYGM